MTTEWVMIQFFNIPHNPCPKRVQVNVSHQFQKIVVFLTQYGFVAILEKMAMPVMALIKGDGISSQQASHHSGNGNLPGLYQQMKMIWDQGPGKATCSGFPYYSAEPVQKIIAVLTVLKYFAAFNSPSNDVM
jgi:hypothetical protein